MKDAKQSAYSTKKLKDHFFLPELCEAEALLSTVLLAELLVFVLVLAEPELSIFDWVRLAMISLFVQWIVLLSATLLCVLRPKLAQLKLPIAAFCCCALVVGVTLFCSAIADFFNLGIRTEDEGRIDFYLRHAATALIMSVVMLRYFYLHTMATARTSRTYCTH